MPDPFTPAVVDEEPSTDVNMGPCKGCSEAIIRPYIVQDAANQPEDRGVHVDEAGERWHRACFAKTYGKKAVA